ncbi:MAG: biotin--[acetyl-CoA-carboxylase] ligase [Cyclobacteriaceae bacterium]
MESLSLTTTQFGKQLFYYPSCGSTNQIASQLIRDKQAEHGALVWTDHQVAGRGQQNKSWESEAGQNIAASLIVYPQWSVSQQFYLNMAVSLAIREAIQHFLSDLVLIKWPNDIFIQDRKLVGILIQNSLMADKIHTSVIGMGINVNQQEFCAPRATSLAKEIDQQFSRGEILNLVLVRMESRYQQLLSQDYVSIKSDYESYLLGKDELRIFSDNNEKFSGMIIGVDSSGRLMIRVENEVLRYNFQEIVYHWE